MKQSTPRVPTAITATSLSKIIKISPLTFWVRIELGKVSQEQAEIDQIKDQNHGEECPLPLHFLQRPMSLEA